MYRGTGEEQDRYIDRDRNKKGIQTGTGTRQVYRHGQEEDRYKDRDRNKTGIQKGTGTRQVY